MQLEAEVLRGLSTQKRCVAATLGGGAATTLSTYKHLYGSIIVWVGEVAGEVVGGRGGLGGVGAGAVSSRPPHRVTFPPHQVTQA